MKLYGSEPWGIREQDILFHRGNGVQDCKLYINDKKNVVDLCTSVEKLLKIGKHKVRTQLRVNWQWMTELYNAGNGSVGSIYK